MSERETVATSTPLPSRRFALITVCLVMFLTFMDMTIVSVALGSVRSDLHAGVTQLQWVVNGYGLTFASFMLLGGSLGDRLGRKKIMLLGLGLFAAGSLLGAVATSSSVLIGARVIMGVGAAASEPGTLSVLRQMYPEGRKRARAIGTWAAVSGLALACGPVIGGVLVAGGSWRAVFWFNVVAAIAIVVLALRSVPESSNPQSGKMDYSGFLLGSLGLGGLTFAVILGETNGYRTSWVIGLFLVGVVALVSFVRVERRTEFPLLALQYFRSSRFSGAIIVAFILYFSIFSIFFFTALYLTAVTNYTPEHTALEFVPMAGAMILSSVFAGRRVARIGPRAPMAEGCVMAGAGVLLSALLLESAHPSAWLMATLALAGFGFGSSVVPMTSVTLAEVPPERSGMAASATNTSRELGAVFGVAVLGALVNAQLTGALERRLQALNVPRVYFQTIINYIETGSAPAGVSIGSGTGNSIQDRVVAAVYGAFRNGLEQSLIVAGVAMLVAAGIAVRTLGPGRTSGATKDFEI
ncbi:MAG: MFS transporter [Acidimicrobiaceae bacterium]|nr:MFS transporter [Acidimicrobiaceae bacterium]